MSVVAVKKIKEGVFDVVSDSITVIGYTKLSEYNTEISSKLFQTNGLIIGYCGSACGLLRVFASTHKPSSATVEGVLDFFSEFCEWRQKRTGEYNMDGDFIICFGGKAFSVHHDFDIQEIESHYAIGAGMEYALTAMHLGHSALEAVKVAIELSAYCYGPTVEFSTCVKKEL